MNIFQESLLRLGQIVFVVCLFSNCASAMFTFSKDSHIYAENKENRIYTGTRLDVGVIGDGGGHAGTLMLAYSIFDLPFSFALDTVFLPYTVTRYIISPRPPWKKQQILDWYHTWVKGKPDYHGKFFYRGSDQQFHHFMAHPIDSWVIIRSYKAEIKLPNQLIFEYSEKLADMKAVDPDNGFVELLQN